MKKILFAIMFFTLLSCQTQKQFNKKGLSRGWIDTTTVVVYDTIKFKGSSKDTLFMSSSDTLYLRDSLFTTKYFFNEITHQNYLQTDVKPQEKVVIKEIHTTSIKQAQYTFTEHLKAVWYIWLALFVLLLIIALIALFKKNK